MYLDIKETILKVSSNPNACKTFEDEYVRLAPFVHLVPLHIPIYVKSYELARYCSLFQQPHRVVQFFDIHITSYEYGSLERKEKKRAGLHDRAVDGLEWICYVHIFSYVLLLPFPFLFLCNQCHFLTKKRSYKIL